MSKNIPSEDLRTLGYVMRRVNYGEADRILDVITPQGKMAVVARGVRKSKSKLAGGIEIFSLVEFNFHFGKSAELGIVTGARMVKYYGEILKNFDKLELAGKILKKIDRVAESSDSKEFFEIVDQTLKALDGDMEISLVESWFVLNLLKAMGEEVNLYRDTDGEALAVEERYNWDAMQKAFKLDSNGIYSEREIKMLRLIYTAALEVVSRVKIDPELEKKVLDFAKMQNY